MWSGSLFTGRVSRFALRTTSNSREKRWSICDSDCVVVGHHEGTWEDILSRVLWTTVTFRECIFGLFESLCSERTVNQCPEVLYVYGQMLRISSSAYSVLSRSKRVQLLPFFPPRSPWCLFPLGKAPSSRDPYISISSVHVFTYIDTR